MNLFDILLGVARGTAMLREGKASGGATTNIVDSVQRTEADDSFNGGTAFITYDAAGAGAAPQSESKLVTDFGSNTINTEAFSVAVTANDYYGVMNKRYPRWAMIQSVNEALRDFGRIGQVDSTTLDTAGDTREYNLPTAAKNDLRQVWLAQDTGTPKRWLPLREWRTEWTAGGSTGKLIFNEQLPAGYDIKLIYMDDHSEVRDDSDTISEYIPPQLLIGASLANVFRWRLMKVGASNSTAVQFYNEAQAELERIRRLFLINHPEKLPLFWMEERNLTVIRTPA
jgi:hypothetical protein